MAFTWFLTADDLTIQNGKLVNVAGSDEVSQRIAIALKHEFNEYFLNFPAGVPWYSALLGSKDKKMAELILRKAVLDVLGVISVIDVSIKSSTSSRAVEISVSAEVQNGDQIAVSYTNIYGQLSE